METLISLLFFFPSQLNQLRQEEQAVSTTRQRVDSFRFHKNIIPECFKKPFQSSNEKQKKKSKTFIKRK